MHISIILGCLLVVVTPSNGLTATEKTQLLDRHNDVRANVQPTASNMRKLKWSDALATTAQTYANQCSMAHNSARSSGPSFEYVGENKYVTTGSIHPEAYNGTATVKKWASEAAHYTLSSNTCNSQTCGHYTQVVWATTEYLGCGAKLCSSVQGLHGLTNAYIVVCNYGNGGNYRGVKPYTKGTSCSQCPSGTTCENKLCKDQFQGTNDQKGKF